LKNSCPNGKVDKTILLDILWQLEGSANESMQEAVLAKLAWKSKNLQ
jgi:hypothetical protein